MPRYTNLNPEHRRPNGRELLRWAVIDPLLGRRKVAPAGRPADRVEPDLEAVHNSDGNARLTWIGHASFLLNLAGTRVLIDPVFSKRVGLKYRRHVRPGLMPQQLPAIDVLLVSHSHYDHLDAPSVSALDRRMTVVVPEGLGAWFRRRRFERVVELCWWEAVRVERLTITFVPARHWTQRSLWDYNRSHWGGFVIADDQLALYHAGDTAWFDGFSAIGERFPELQLALLPIGGYEPGWFMERNHMTPEQALEAFAQLAARRMIPMHWGTFQLTDEPLREPLDRLLDHWGEQQELAERKLLLPAIGETLSLE